MPSLIDASLFHRRLRLHVGGVDYPHLRASMVLLTCEHHDGARPHAKLSFVHSLAEQESGDLTLALSTIPLGTGVDIADAGDDGQPRPLFTGVVNRRGLQVMEGSAPQVWIACEGTTEVADFASRARVRLSFGSQISALALSEQAEGIARETLSGSTERPVMRGEVSVPGWLTAMPGDTVELRNTGSVFDGDAQVLAVTQCSDNQGTTTVLTVQRA